MRSVGKPPISFKDYERIYKTIHSIVEAEGGKVAHACLYFSIMGAYLLNEHYRLHAKVYGGGAIYQLGGDKRKLMFGEIKDNVFTSGPDGFHLWIEVDGWLIDFMAPNFPLLPTESNSGLETRLLMLPLTENKNRLSNFSEGNEFLLLHNNALANEVIDQFFSYPANKDFLDIAINWFCKPSKKMKKGLELCDQNGCSKPVAFTGRSLIGAW